MGPPTQTAALTRPYVRIQRHHSAVVHPYRDASVFAPSMQWSQDDEGDKFIFYTRLVCAQTLARINEQTVFAEEGNDRSSVKICARSQSVSSLWRLVKQTGEYLWVTHGLLTNRATLGWIFLNGPHKNISGLKEGCNYKNPSGIFDFRFKSSGALEYIERIWTLVGLKVSPTQPSSWYWHLGTH